VAERISLKALLTHAEKNGVDQVAETAAELGGMTEEILTDLIEKLDAINDGFRRDPRLKKLYRQRKNSYPADRRARELLGIPEPEDLAKPSRKKPPAKGKVTGRPKKETARGGTRRKRRS
jgi:hypothetical protein